MKFQEALEQCNMNGWTKYVLMNRTLLGDNVFLTKSYRTKSKGPVSGLIDKSEEPYLKMVIYEGGNNFNDDISLPYECVDPDSDGWQPDVFMGDLSIGEFELGGITLKEQDGNIDLSTAMDNKMNLAKMREFVDSALKKEYKLTSVELNDIMDVSKYFD